MQPDEEKPEPGSCVRAIARRHPHAITLAGCWAHVRRYFHEAREEAPRRAGWVLRQVQHLYRVEAELREKRAGPQLREAVRGAQSRMVVQRLRRVLERMRPKTLPKSLLGEAIAFALEQWPRLEVFLTNGRVEIDNNQIENAIRPTAVGKKNWLFVGDADAGERGAILYTVIESCRRRGIDPLAYLRDVLTRLPKMTNHQLVDLLPHSRPRHRRHRLQTMAPMHRRCFG